METRDREECVLLAWKDADGDWKSRRMHPSRLSAEVFRLRRARTEYRYQFGESAAVVYRSVYRQEEEK